MLFWGDSTARPSFSSRPVYLRSASSPAKAIPTANLPAIPKPPINGPPSPTLPPESSSSSSPDTADSNGYDVVSLVWHPPSPPISEIRQPAMDQVMLFVAQSPNVTREFHDIAPSTYERILRRLECKLFEYHPRVRYVIPHPRPPSNTNIIEIDFSHLVSTTSVTTPG